MPETQRFGLGLRVLLLLGVTLGTSGFFLARARAADRGPRPLGPLHGRQDLPGTERHERGCRPGGGKAASFLQNGGAVTGAGDPRMWLQRASAVGPGAALPPTARSAARPRSSEPPRHTRAPARPPVPSLSPSLPARLGSGVGSRLEQPGPPRSRAPGAAPSDRTTGAGRGGDGWEGFGARSPRRAGRARPCSGRGCPTARPFAPARPPPSRPPPRGPAPPARRAADVRFRACARCCAFPLPPFICSSCRYDLMAWLTLDRTEVKPFI